MVRRLHSFIMSWFLKILMCSLNCCISINMYNKFVHLLNLLVNGAKYSTLSFNLTSPVFINFSLISRISLTELTGLTNTRNSGKFQRSQWRSLKNWRFLNNWKYQDYQFQQLHISTNYFDVSLVCHGQTVTIRCKTICWHAREQLGNHQGSSLLWTWNR